MEKYKEFYKEVERPTWENYFLGLAFDIAERSEDAETHHGAVIVDPRFNHILGTGYNSFARGVQPYELPNVRPEKYSNGNIIHAEENAVLNTRENLFHLPDGATIYITAKPCLSCLYRMSNANIRTIYYAETGYHFKGYESEAEDFTSFVKRRSLSVYSIEPDLTWLKKPLLRLGLLDNP